MANVALADDGQYSELEQNDAPSNGEKKLGKNAPVAMAASNTEAQSKSTPMRADQNEPTRFARRN